MAAILLLLVLFASGHFEEVGGKCIQKVDLLFVIDTSSSICEGSEGTTCKDWIFAQDLVKDTVQDMDIGPDNTRVGVITFADYTVIASYLNTNMEKGALLKAIDNVEYTGGERNTTGAFQTALSDIFVVQNGDRPDVPDMIITLIGGPPTRAASSLKAAVAELRKRRIALMTPGILFFGKDSDLRMISSPLGVLNNDYFKVASNQALNAVREDLSANICKLLT